MKKFEGWRTDELQYVATMIASREMLDQEGLEFVMLYQEIIREIRNRRIQEEMAQMKLPVSLEAIEEE